MCKRTRFSLNRQLCGLMTMMKPFVIVALVFSAATGFHPGPGRLVVAKRPVAIVARHVTSVAIADEPPYVAHNANANGLTSTTRRRGRRGGRNRRRSAESTVNVIETLNTPRFVRSKSRPPTHQLAVFNKVNVSSALKPIRYVLNPWSLRALLRETWSRRAACLEVDIATSVDFSILECRNDFELVTRAGKELEFILETFFETPCGKGVSLPVKMRMARTADGEPLSPGLMKNMKHVLKIRNALVHKRHVNALGPYRHTFIARLDEVLRELATEKERLELQRQGSTVPPPAANVISVTTTEVVTTRRRAREPVFSSLLEATRTSTGTATATGRTRPVRVQSGSTDDEEEVYRA